MPDELPKMNAGEAVAALRIATKPFRAILDLERVLQAAIDAELGLITKAKELDAQTQALQDLQGMVARAQAVAQAAQSEAARTMSGANARAAQLLADARAAAEGALADARKQIAAEGALDATRKAAADEALDEVSGRNIALQAQNVSLSSMIVEKQAQLDTIRAAIAAAAKV